jgi:hypothetical protein
MTLSARIRLLASFLISFSRVIFTTLFASSGKLSRRRFKRWAVMLAGSVTFLGTWKVCSHEHVRALPRSEAA